MTSEKPGPVIHKANPGWIPEAYRNVRPPSGFTLFGIGPVITNPGDNNNYDIILWSGDRWSRGAGDADFLYAIRNRSELHDVVFQVQGREVTHDF